MGQPVVRQKDPHAGCTLTCGISVDVRVTNVRVNGDQPAAAAGPTQCTMGEGAHGPGDPHVIFKPIGPAIAVGQPTACGGVESAGSGNVHLVGPGGGWGKALFDWLNAPADPVLYNRLQGTADLEAGISTEMKAATLGMLPDPTLASKAAAAFFALRGADAIVAAKNRILTGQATETYVDQGVGNVAKAAGANDEQANFLKGAVDTGLNTLGGKLQGRAGISKSVVTGETKATKTGKEIHAKLAAERRASGDFDQVNAPLTDSGGKPIVVTKRIDLKTGEPLPGSGQQVAKPDAVSFKDKLILDDKPVGRPISKDRQEIIRFIKAYEEKEGVPPGKIAIQRYDPKTGKLVVTELYTPQDFHPWRPQ